MARAIETRGLTKYYGSTRGIVDVDLAVKEGEVFGFLGPNGAGKTTTIRLLLDLIRPTEGAATVLGRDSHADSVEINRRVGFLPGDVRLYDTMTGRELLTYFGHLRGMTDWPYARSVAERFELDLDVKVGSYSSGNYQKLGLVQAFMHQPDLLILDEPTSALDPLVQQEFYRIVEETKAEGRTVFLSSHVLPEVERIADRVGIIREGRLIVVEEVEALKQRALRRMEIQFAAPVPAGSFDGLPSVLEARYHDSSVELMVEGPLDSVVKSAARFEVHNIISHEADLEQIFLEMYRGEV
jgi:ABC-2 type transport system ATP-binding protein